MLGNEAQLWLYWKKKTTTTPVVYPEKYRNIMVRVRVRISSGHTKRRGNDRTARSIIRPMSGRHASLITAGAVWLSVPLCLQRIKTSTLYIVLYLYIWHLPITVRDVRSIHVGNKCTEADELPGRQLNDRWCLCCPAIPLSLFVWPIKQ